MSEKKTKKTDPWFGPDTRLLDAAVDGIPSFCRMLNDGLSRAGLNAYGLTEFLRKEPHLWTGDPYTSTSDVEDWIHGRSAPGVKRRLDVLVAIRHVLQAQVDQDRSEFAPIQAVLDWSETDVGEAGIEPANTLYSLIAPWVEANLTNTLQDPQDLAFLASTVVQKIIQDKAYDKRYAKHTLIK